MVPPPPRAQASSGDDAEAAVVQQRLGRMGLAMTSLGGLYITLFTLSLLQDPAVHLGDAVHMPYWFQFGFEETLFVAFWLLGRVPPLSARALRGLEAAGLIALGASFATAVFFHPYPIVGVYEALLAVAAMLGLRAAMVPSTAARTAVLGVLASTPTFVLAPLAGVLGRLPGTDAGSLLGMSVNWSLITVAVSATASGTIYGLRREVRAARRLGQYELVRRLGSGAMGVVYLARHAMLRRPTAIKVLSHGRGTPEGLARFEREVQVTSELLHPNTIVIYDYGRTADGLFYYAMELVDGVDLEALVAVEGPQPPARVVHLLAQVCGALHEAHLKGLLHRDVKLANVMVRRDALGLDAVKVLDFGLVHEVREGSTGLVGTPVALSPESITRATPVDARSDLYAVGVMGWTLLVGHPPFSAGTLVELCAAHVHQPPPPLPAEVPEALARLVMACLEKDPARRPASAGALEAALRRAVVEPPWSPGAALERWARFGPAHHQHQATRASSRGLSETVLELETR